MPSKTDANPIADLCFRNIETEFDDVAGDFVAECYRALSYGGGLRSIEDVAV